VNLAMLEIRRNGATSNADGADDFERAKKNLQRALAIDDGHMPAFNQLAVLHLEVARREASAHKRKLDAQALELALLVCSQGIKKNPRYAPIHNTAGMIHAELADLSRAVASFNEARRIDPSFFEAHMNAAAVNLQFRGFAEAEGAYRDALRSHPDDYEARLGLALALRGQIDEGDPRKNFALAEEQLGLATKLAPRRPEAFYNAALLTMGYKAKATGGDPTKTLTEAKRLFDDFITRAQGSPALDARVKDARERIHEIDVLIDWHARSSAP
jgi:tetratricopeptide (TPR) repeat protein